MVIERGRGFWAVGALALLLSLVSWINLPLVRLLNAHLFHNPAQAVAGWWVYVLLRLCATGGLLWLIRSFPERGASSAPAKRPEPGPAPRLFDPLLGLRAFACFLVLMGHYFLVVFPFLPTPREHSFAPFLRSSPWAGVWIFFTLSGFLMGKGFATHRYRLDEAGCRAFWYNRALRIAPVYYLGLLLVMSMRYPALFLWKNLWLLLEIAMFDYRGDLPVPIMGALWSVSTEVQFYLLVPVLMVGLFWLRKWMGRAFLALPLVWLCAGTLLRLLILHRESDRFDVYGYAPMLPNLDIFLFGMTLSMLPRWRHVEGWLVRRRGILLLISVPLFYMLISGVTAGRVRLHLGELPGFWAKTPPLCALYAGAFIVLAETGSKFPLRPRPGWRLLWAVEWMGTLTYCLYVFHSEIFLNASTLFPGAHTLSFAFERFVPVMLVTVGVAYFFYYFVEEPFQSKKRVGSPGLLDAP